MVAMELVSAFSVELLETVSANWNLPEVIKSLLSYTNRRIYDLKKKFINAEIRRV